MSSDGWREHERSKIEETLKLQALKDARKAVREAKRIEAEKMASEKRIAKTQKLVAAKKAADDKLTRSHDHKNKQKNSKNLSIVCGLPHFLDIDRINPNVHEEMKFY